MAAAGLVAVISTTQLGDATQHASASSETDLSSMVTLLHKREKPDSRQLFGYSAPIETVAPPLPPPPTTMTPATSTPPPTSSPRPQAHSTSPTREPKPRANRSKPARPVNVDLSSALVRLTNSIRASKGLAGLSVDTNLVGLAKANSQHMAGAHAAQHSSLRLGSGQLARYTSFGENVLSAPASFDPSQLIAMWMNSAGHRANILQGGFDHVGIAAVVEGDKVYVSQLFASG